MINIHASGYTWWLVMSTETFHQVAVHVVETNEVVSCTTDSESFGEERMTVRS